MTMITINKYDMIRVGDRIIKPNSKLILKGGIIAKIEKLNQHAMTVHLHNGGSLEISRYKPNDYELYRPRKNIQD